MASHKRFTKQQSSRRQTLGMPPKRVQTVSTHRYYCSRHPILAHVYDVASMAHFYRVVNGKTKLIALTRQQLFYHVEKR